MEGIVFNNAILKMKIPWETILKLKVLYQMYKNLGRSCINLSSCQLVVFALENEEYAVNISYTQEIMRVPKLRKIPSTPDFVEGVFNLRGNVISVVDLKRKFEMGQWKKNIDNRLLVLDLDGMKLGIIVDDVAEVLRVEEDTIHQINDEIVGISKNSIQGIALIDERIIMVLDALKLKAEIFINKFEKELAL